MNHLKNADFEYIVRADSGYESVETGRISPDQHSRISAILSEPFTRPLILAVSFQEESWADDGGDHDVFLTVVSDEDYKALKEILGLGKTPILFDHEVLFDRIKKGKIFKPKYPLTIDDCLTILFRY